jgi:hypothetical protein
MMRGRLTTGISGGATAPFADAGTSAQRSLAIKHFVGGVSVQINAAKPNEMRAKLREKTL